MPKTHHNARHLHRLALVELREREDRQEIRQVQTSGRAEKRLETPDLEGVQPSENRLSGVFTLETCLGSRNLQKAL